MSRLLEVRCCCRPQNLLGWLEVPEHIAAERPITFALLGDMVNVGDGVQTLTLRARRYRTWTWLTCKEYLALSADETPIETLRRIPGFKENHETSVTV